jgi:two-component system sensor histidine kinase KdpD
VYDSTQFGPDPEAEGLQKDPKAPWAAAPLVVGGRLYGQIIADNGRSQRIISSEALDYLTLLAALAAQAIANEATIEDLRAKELTRRFLEVALHDLKSPVHSIKNISERLTSEAGIDSSQRVEWLNLLNAEAQRLDYLVKQADTYTRLGRSERPRQHVSLRELVSDTSQIVAASAGHLGVHVDIDLPSDACVIEADREGLQVALNNVLENALKFSRAGERIGICLSQVSPLPNTWHYRISIQDEGPGIPDGEKQEIFDELVSIPRSGVPESTGLGLPTARKIVEAHGGTLECFDGPNNQGADFVFALPGQAHTPLTNGGRDGVRT